MGAGASVRLVEGSNGIRFASTFSKSLIDFVNSNKDVGTAVKYGTIILPTDVLNTVNDKSAFNVNTLISSGLEEGTGYVDIIAKDGFSEDESGNVTIRAALVNLKEKNFDRALSAVSYIKYVKDGHDVYVFSNYSSDDNSRSMAYIAQAALNDLKDTSDSSYKYEVTVDGSVKFSCYSPAQRSILQGYIPTAN